MTSRIYWTVCSTLAGLIIMYKTASAERSYNLESLWQSEILGETIPTPDNQERFKQNLLNYVFHANGPVTGVRAREIPMVMGKIYDLVADRKGGQTRQTHQPAFDVDIIRGLEDSWASDRRMQFLFNTSNINTTTDDVVEAQFHIFKRKTFADEIRREHHVRLCLYKVLDENNLYNQDGSVNTISGATLLETRQVSAYSSEWIIFDASHALRLTVISWLRDPSSNKGFLLTATDSNDHHVNGTHVDFVQRHEYPHGRQPVLVVFANQDKPASGTKRSRAREDYHHVTMYLNEDTRCIYSGASREEYDRCMARTRRTRRDLSRPLREDVFSRMVRSTRASMNEGAASYAEEVAWTETAGRNRRSRVRQRAQSSASVSDDFELPSEQQNVCKKEPLYVSFEALGWGRWIVAPEGIHASQCNGRCPFPLTSAFASTNHAVLKSVSNFYKPTEVKPPCCVPEKLGKMSILYHETDSVVTMRNYDGMIVESCGCR